MNRKILFLFVLTLPLLFLCVAIQSSSYQTLASKVKEQEKTQSYLADRNKKLTIGIEALASPNRIEPLASTELNLDLPSSQKAMRIHFTESEDKQ